MTFNSTPFNTAPFNYHVPASETPQGRERVAAYYVALGRFIDRFSRAESAIEYVLRHYAGVGPKVAVAIFSGVRVDAATKQIKRLAESTKLTQERRTELEDCLTQLDVINGARNAILHFGANDIAEGKGVVTNELKRGERATWFPISPDSLDKMFDDLRRIVTLLLMYHAGRPIPKSARAIVAALTPAWQYKHDERPMTPTTKEASQPTPKRNQ